MAATVFCRCSAILIAIASLAVSVKPADASLFVNFESTGITWDNTRLAGGAPQPIGWVELADGADGVISASDFLGVSDVTFGSRNVDITWTAADLLPESTVTLSGNQVVDMNMLFEQDGTIVALAGGGPTPAWSVANTPAPPAQPFVGFPEIENGFARGPLSVSLDSNPVSTDVEPTLPDRPGPLFPAHVPVNVSDGFVELDLKGGLSFDLPTGFFDEVHSELNGDNFIAVAGFKQNTNGIDEPDPNKDRVRFSRTDINHEGSYSLFGGPEETFTDADLDPNNNGFTVLNGPAFSLMDIEQAFVNAIDGIAQIFASDVGVLVVEGGFHSASIALGVYDTATQSDLAQLLGLAGFGDLLAQLNVDGEDLFSLSSKFSGKIEHEAVTVPIVSPVPEFSSSVVWGVLLTVGCSCYWRRRRQRAA